MLSVMKTKLPEKKKRQAKKRAHRPTALPITNAGNSPMVGNEERLSAYAKRALQLKRLGYYHYQIAEKIAEEFELEKEPAITTVADWLKKGDEAVSRDIEELKWQMRIEQYKELDRMKSKFMAIACANELEIRRWQMVEGELQPVIDESAMKEQTDAARVVVQIMNRQARLLGLDMEKAITQTGEGPQDLQSLQIWMIGQINMTTGAPNGGAVDIQSEVLELRTGIPEIDNDNQV